MVGLPVIAVVGVAIELDVLTPVNVVLFEVTVHEIILLAAWARVVLIRMCDVRGAL